MRARSPVTRLVVATALCATAPALAAASLTEQVQANYAGVAEASYGDALAAARTMRGEIKAFLAHPSAEGLDKARKSWLAAREWYGQTEAFRFYGGPIDGADGPEPRINSWPVDEAYLDYVEGRPVGGIINDAGIPLSRDKLVALNQKGGEENISTGWHAIEFLLWGQDLDPDGPGHRPHTDYVDGKGANAARRRQYLGLIADLLVDDLATVAAAWAPGADNYRARFVRDPEGMKKILTGFGVLTRGELCGERLEVAMDSQSQEDEHSCFSDNTHRDVVVDTWGIRNVWEGRYKRADGTLVAGPGLKDLVSEKSPKVAEKLTADIAASVAAAEAIHAPFDREILGNPQSPGRRRVQATIDALKTQARDLVAVAEVLGVKRLATRVK